MKKISMLLVLLLAMAMGSHRVFAQSVTVTLMPGWNWISNPTMDTLDFAAVLGSFTPAVGDIIQSQWGSSSYLSNGQWRGNVSQFYPGYGYMYKSNRTMPVMLTFNAQQPAPQVIVTTMEPTNITTNSATCGGNVASSDGNYVFVILRGICWSTSPNPTFNDNYVEVGNGIGSFTASMTDLSTGTTYYVRAFAVTANGTFYGEQMIFNTIDGIPTLSTVDVTEITSKDAICGGNITDDGGLAITARGVCWSTSPNPTIADSHTVDGSGTGNFNSSIIGLSPSTTYYVRAYATNVYDTAYGDEKTFITLDIPIGTINGLFTINSNGDQVYFSQGNLQYIGSASTPYWKFADNQWDVIGITTGQNSSDQNVDRDLFGWGTSGWNNGNTFYRPWDTNNSGGYSYGPDGLYDLTGTYANADWGVYNPLSNGGNQANQWRTLTKDEWTYVFNSRTTSSGIRYAKAKVNAVNGVILLPDDWSSVTYSLSNTNSPSADFSSNTISASQWNTLEQAGAVFLPAAGLRIGTSVSYVGSYCYYWSASYGNGSQAYGVYFYSISVSLGSNDYRYCGYSVRLVQDL